MKIEKLKHQVNYFGYQLEPLNLINERDSGQIDKFGFYNFDRMKDKDINDAWLDSLDHKHNQDLGSLNSKRTIKGVYSDSESEEDEDEGAEPNLAKKVKVSEEGGVPAVDEKAERRNRLANLPIIAIKKRLDFALLEPEETPNAALIRLKKQAEQSAGFKAPTRPAPFKKNVRKSNAGAATVASEERREDAKTANQDSSAQNELQDKFEMVIDLCDIIIEKTGQVGKSFYNELAR